MKTAVVLFNLGGPDSLASVRPFLFNLFYDKAILSLPNPLRYLLAQLISRRRAPESSKMYARIGGKSPLLELTRDQAAALQTALGETHRVFICMRYFHPLTEEAVAQVKAWNPDRVLLLPLYPHYSTTTTGSSYARWQAECRRQGFNRPTRLVCCYPEQPAFLEAHAALLRPAHAEALAHGNPLVIFSAHGLPEKVIHAGDPYQWQVEQTVKNLVAGAAIAGMDHVIAYQSRVGPLRWIGPYTDDVITDYARQNRPLVVVPIAFVSEHSETLVELDHDYRELAMRHGCPRYVRVPALGVQPDFIRALAALAHSGFDKAICPQDGKRLCPINRTQCPTSLEASSL